LKKAPQKLLLCWAEGLKVPTVRSTVGIAPEGMGTIRDSAHGPHKIKVFLLLFFKKEALPYSSIFYKIYNDIVLILFQTC
jgi:hypothetical protein